MVDYDPLTPVIDVEESVKDEVLVHEAAGTNAALKLGDPLDESFFDGCEYLYRLVKALSSDAP